MRALRVVILIALVAWTACGESPPDQKPSTAEGAPSGDGGSGVVVRVEIQVPGNQTFPAIDPVTGDLWFSVYEDSFDDQTIMVARKEEAGWAAPEVAPFSGTSAWSIIPAVGLGALVVNGVMLYAYRRSVARSAGDPS